VEYAFIFNRFNLEWQRTLSDLHKRLDIISKPLV
jgi:hypothetical protein